MILYGESIQTENWRQQFILFNCNKAIKRLFIDDRMYNIIKNNLS